MRGTPLPMRKSVARKSFAKTLMLGCAFAALLTVAPARAEDIFDSVMKSVGLQGGDTPDINYRERSPLVIPPGRDLPPPETSASAAVPNWPVDADVKRAKKEKAKREQSAPPEVWQEAGRPLRPHEMQGLPRTGPYTSTGNNANMSEYEGQRLSRPDELKSKSLFGNIFGNKNEEAAKFTGEPPRASLTDPPAGYQTPSADQPYGLGKEKVINKAYDYKNQHGTEQ